MVRVRERAGERESENERNNSGEEGGGRGGWLKVTAAQGFADTTDRAGQYKHVLAGQTQ